MSNAYFAFRQFGIRQDRCAMKVSSDACVFGAWIPVPEQPVRSILDIGAGTGLLSLMLAQRIPSAKIDAIEIDPSAASQARENFDDSIFRDRLQLICGDARELLSEFRYDLIVSNPPFFSRSLKSPDAARNAARHDDILNLATLFEIVTTQLKDDGCFALLMPYDATATIDRAAEHVGLRTIRRLDILDNPEAAPRRSCWLFGRTDQADRVPRERCVVRDGSVYGPDFRTLLDAFYLRL